MLVSLRVSEKAHSQNILEPSLVNKKRTYKFPPISKVKKFWVLREDTTYPSEYTL